MRYAQLKKHMHIAGTHYTYEDTMLLIPYNSEDDIQALKDIAQGSHWHAVVGTGWALNPLVWTENKIAYDKGDETKHTQFQIITIYTPDDERLKNIEDYQGIKTIEEIR